MRAQVRQAKDGKGLPIIGKQRIKYFDDAGKYLSQETIQGDKAMGKARAKNRLREMENERHLEAIGMAQNKTDIRKALAEYLKDKTSSGGKGQGKWAKGSKYRAELRLGHWLDAMAWTTIADITRKDVALHLAELRQTGISDATHASYQIQIRAFTKWLTDLDMLPKDPLKGLKLGRIVVKDKRRALTAEELIAVFEVCDVDEYFLFKGAAVSGMRVRELEAMRLDWIDWDRGGVNLPAFIDKARRERFIEMPRDYLAELKAYCHGKGPKDPVYRAFWASNASRVLAKYCRRAGVPMKTAKGKIVFHSLRYSFVSMVNALNPDLKTRLQMSRHEDMATNMIYTDEEIMARRNVSEAISRKLRGHQGGTLEEWTPGSPENKGPEADRSESGIFVSSIKSPISQDESPNSPQNRHLHLRAGTPVSQPGREAQSQGRSHAKLATSLQEIWALLPDADRQSIVNHARGLLLGLKVHKRGVA